ncbi:MAG: hypothetical protein EBZ77_14635 [Chitinophagia bacterium]|nr:hypothetical protein [Chitinophagia bacterium]
MKILTCNSLVLDNTPFGTISTLVALPMRNYYEVSANTEKGIFVARIKSVIDYHMGGGHLFEVQITIHYESNAQPLVIEEFTQLMRKAVQQRNTLISDMNSLHNPQLHLPVPSDADLTAMFLQQLVYELA